MSSQMYNTLNDPAQSLSLQHKGNSSRGALVLGAVVGLIPLGLLLLIGAVTVLLTALARQIVALSGFFAQQQASVIVLIVGLVVALVAYVMVGESLATRWRGWSGPCYVAGFRVFCIGCAIACGAGNSVATASCSVR